MKMLDVILGYDPGTYEVILPDPEIDPVQTKADLALAIAYSEQGLASLANGMLTANIVGPEVTAAMQRLLTTFEAMSQDPVRWPAFCAWWNSLG